MKKLLVTMLLVGAVQSNTMFRVATAKLTGPALGLMQLARTKYTGPGLYTCDVQYKMNDFDSSTESKAFKKSIKEEVSRDGIDAVVARTSVNTWSKYAIVKDRMFDDMGNVVNSSKNKKQLVKELLAQKYLAYVSDSEDCSSLEKIVPELGEFKSEVNNFDGKRGVFTNVYNPQDAVTFADGKFLKLVSLDVTKQEQMNEYRQPSFSEKLKGLFGF